MSLGDLFQRAVARGEELVFRARLDPYPARVARVARVARKIDVLGEVHPLAGPSLARLALRAGLSVRTVHAIHALHTPERPALVDARGVRTYAEVDRAINRAAHAFRDELGIQRGDAMALAAENCAEYIIAWFALMRIGARAVHASYRSQPAELEYLATHAGLRAILVSEASLDAASQVAAAHGWLRVVAVGERAGAAVRFDDLLARARSSDLPEVPARHAGGESIVYTSGTTGKPKGAVRDFARFGVIEGARLLERLPFRIGDRHLVVTPLYHSGAQAVALINAALGATIHLHRHFEPDATLEALSRSRIHSVFLVPTMIRRLVELPAELRARMPTPELRALVSGASEFPEALRREAIAMFGAPVVHDFYGATELGWVTLINGSEMLARTGSVGRPLPGQAVAIFDRQGRELPLGETGLVYVRNEQTMSGYLGDAAATEETRRGPWVTVEDLGRVDADGYLYISGRERDMVKSGGVNLYPVEIEEVIARHPSVRDVAVIGLPDPEWGERLAAVVVPRGELDPSDVERFARTLLSSVKVPKEWHVVDEIPRNPTGKTLKRELRARYSK
ncbi:long-chain-fatty-acid--CoA ligase FadD2 [soil metagenome]